jgi:hypothetical protein
VSGGDDKKKERVNWKAEKMMRCLLLTSKDEIMFFYRNLFNASVMNGSRVMQMPRLLSAKIFRIMTLMNAVEFLLLTFNTTPTSSMLNSLQLKS